MKTPRKTHKISTRGGPVFTFGLPGGADRPLAPLSVTPDLIVCVFVVKIKALY